MRTVAITWQRKKRHFTFTSCLPCEHSLLLWRHFGCVINLMLRIPCRPGGIRQNSSGRLLTLMSKIHLYKNQWAAKLKSWRKSQRPFANELPPFHRGKFMHAHKDASLLRHCVGIDVFDWTLKLYLYLNCSICPSLAITPTWGMMIT